MDNLRSSEEIRGLAITKRNDREEVNEVVVFLS